MSERTATKIIRRPTAVGVERSRNPHRILLQFDKDEPIELLVHDALHLVNSITGMLCGAIPSEHVMALGVRESERYQFIGWVKDLRGDGHAKATPENE